MADAPGYAAVLHPSPGSECNETFVFGNGERVANLRLIKLRMKSKDDDSVLMSSVFQEAEITRPLMSVPRICDQGMSSVFEKTLAQVVDSNGNTVARFERGGGLYICTMRLRLSEARNEPGFARPVP